MTNDGKGEERKPYEEREREVKKKPQ